jgi:hypothetical protein
VPKCADIVVSDVRTAADQVLTYTATLAVVTRRLAPSRAITRAGSAAPETAQETSAGNQLLARYGKEGTRSVVDGSLLLLHDTITGQHSLTKEKEKIA